jgi:hypothetical protein
LKYLNYKKNANPNAHVRVFNVAMKLNGETYEEYIVNAFNYTLRKMASYWGHNYMLEFLDYNFFELMQVFNKHHHKMQNDKHIYMELKSIKQGETKWVKVYYECIQKLVHGLQNPTTNKFLIVVF